MTNKLLIAVVLLLAMNGVCTAESLDFHLTAGSESVAGAVYGKQYLESGYLRVGGSFAYTDDDATQYKIGSLAVTAGSDSMGSGLSGDVGLRALLGTADDGPRSGDIGAVGFTGSVNYLFSADMIPVPLEIFGELTWAPGVLNFMDSDGYLELTLGTGVRVIENVSIVATYTLYRVEMESGPGDWKLKDNVLRFGIVMYF